jgi:subtilisin family serine protease
MRRIALLATTLALAASPARAGDGEPPAPSPDAAFLPTGDMRVAEFLAAHPQDDGRGVVVAVLDTGVDPGHPRLAKTSTGEPKLLDFLDATDDGIVDTSLALEAEGGQVVGATGRVLSLGAHAKPGDGSTLGRVAARDVLPEGLVERLSAKRKERHAEAVRRAKDGPGLGEPARPGEAAAAAEARRKSEAEALEGLPDDVPAFDVLVVKGADGPRVVIDTDADGDLGEERALRDFSKGGDWVTLHDDVEMNVGVRPDADGKRVRLLFDGNGHGTHVSGIVAGFESPGSPWNGVAPGARILAIKVGNSRWGGPTTNLSILRALDAAGQRGATVVNLSFGGASFSGDAGTPDAIGADEAVEKHGLLCCFSAGNEGPALSTVGSPALARRVLSVGAYVAPGTMRVSYGRVGPDPGERLFGFSSRGPLPGGDLGVSVVAPGAAWSALPSWHLVRAENWNGTSMAAPEVSGAAALLLSAARREGVPASPARVIRAVRSSARPVEGLLPVEQGAGLVQVDRAWEALRRMKAAPEERPLVARVVNPTGAGGGVYERGASGEPFERRVRVSVDWPREAANDARASFERRLALASDQAWVQVPPRFAVNASGGSFTVLVDPRALPPGVHVATVSATDPTRAGDGPELVVPVTVLVPEVASDAGLWRGAVGLAAGERASRLLRVPFGATQARLRVSSRGERRTGVSAALASLDGWRTQDDRTAAARWDLAPGDEQEVRVPVVAGTTVEAVVFAQWNAEAPATLEVEVAFEGPTTPDVSVEGGPGEDVLAFRVQSPLTAFRGKVVARVNGTVERPEVERSVAVEPGGPVLGREPLFVATHRFRLRLGANESVTVVPLGTRALDEQREDARWRVVDASGRAVKKAVIDGRFEVSGLAAGTYEVVYEEPTWGRATADTGLTGFEVVRSRPDAEARVFATADLAAVGESPDGALDLPRGSTRTIALRLPGLDAGKIHVGVVEVRDERDRVRLTLPLRVDRRTQRDDDVAGAEESLVRALTTAARGVADDASADATALANAESQVVRARALRPLDRDLEILLLRLLVRLAPNEPARKQALGRVDAALATLDRTKGDDRPRIGRALVARAALKRLSGKPTDGADDLAEARFLLPESDPDVLAERVARGRAEGGDAADALAAARALRDASPADFAAARRVVDVALGAGWAVAAAAEVRGWTDRFPGRLAETVAAARRVRAAGADPATRSLPAVEAAP